MKGLLRRIAYSRWGSGFVCVCGFVCALLASQLIPPIQSPDEHSHLARAYALSGGVILLQANPQTPFDPNARLGVMVDEGLLAFIDRYMEIVVDADRRLSPQEQVEVRSLRWTGREHFLPIPGTGYYLPLVYAPHAIGFFSGQQLGLNVGQTYQLVRLLCIGLCGWLLWSALRQYPGSALVGALLMLPMTLFQLLSPTIDGVTTCLAIYALCLFLRLSDNAKSQDHSGTIALTVCVFLLATCRTQLLPMLLLPFFLAWQRRSPRGAMYALVALVATLTWLAFALVSTHDPRVVREVATSALLLHYLAHPGEVLHIVWATINDPETFTFLQKSFIGILGWLDTHLAATAYIGLWAGLASCALVSIRPREVMKHWPNRSALLIVSLSSGLLVFAAMLLTWTPYPATLIQGVQGRYFLVPMLTLAFAVSGMYVQSATVRWLGWAVLGFFSTYSAVIFVQTLMSRYG